MVFGSKSLERRDFVIEKQIKQCIYLWYKLCQNEAIVILYYLKREKQYKYGQSAFIATWQGRVRKIFKVSDEYNWYIFDLSLKE